MSKVKRYGLPYMGSKNSIADWVVSHFPSADNFYDMCCGGGAISHAAMLSGKYKNIYLNDIDKHMPQMFVDCCNGKYRNEERWISRDDFFALKDSDPYVVLCWSFGNNRRDYMYSRDIEPLKKAFHYAVFWCDFVLMDAFGVDLRPIAENSDRRTRYLAAKKIIREVKGRVDLERLQSLQSLERLQSLQSYTPALTATNLSYNEVVIKPNSVVYCDIPYKNTQKYNSGIFDYESFYDWCGKQTSPLFISEYDMPRDRFECIGEKQKRVTLSATANGKKAIERLFIPKHQVSDYTPNSLF